MKSLQDTDIQPFLTQILVCRLLINNSSSYKGYSAGYQNTTSPHTEDILQDLNIQLSFCLAEDILQDFKIQLFLIQRIFCRMLIYLFFLYRGYSAGYQNTTIRHTEDILQDVNIYLFLVQRIFCRIS